MSLKQHGRLATNGFVFPLFRQMLINHSYCQTWSALLAVAILKMPHIHYIYIYIYISQYHTGQSKLLYDQRKSTALGNRVHILRDILYMPVWHTLPMLLYSRLHPGLLCSLSWYHMHILYLILPISTDDAIYMHTYFRLHSTAFFILQRIHDQCDEKQKTKIHSSWTTLSDTISKDHIL